MASVEADGVCVALDHAVHFPLVLKPAVDGEVLDLIASVKALEDAGVRLARAVLDDLRRFHAGAANFHVGLQTE